MKLVQVCPECGMYDGDPHHPKCPTLAKIGIDGSAEKAMTTTTQSVCSKCKGKGRIITDVLNGRTKECPECQGSWKEEGEWEAAEVAQPSPPSSPNVPCNSMPAPTTGAGSINLNPQPMQEAQQLTAEEVYKQLAGQASFSDNEYLRQRQQQEEYEKQAIDEYLRQNPNAKF